VKVAMIVLAIVVGLLAVLEVSLRLLFGFGNPLIYIADEKIGYLLAPNQRTRRFGNRIEINEYSMRSAAVSKQRSLNTFRVLLLGDSIANGGWWTDQADIISEMLARELQQGANSPSSKLAGDEISPTQCPMPNGPCPVEVLNASANSWGPRNELAYLQRFGTFDAQVVILIINTDDLFAIAPNSMVVGRDRNYPAQKPPLAILEAINRYLLPAKPMPELAAANAEKGDRVGRNLAAIQEIQAITRQTNSHFILVMTPLLREIGNPGPRDYEIKARARLTEFTQSEKIAYIDFLPLFNSSQQPQTLYRDHIHLTALGNQLVSQSIRQEILDFRF
jgi:GDSL-like Lipase/Acylhydrolase family